MKTMQRHCANLLGAAMTIAAIATPVASRACDAETPYIGSVCYMAGNYCPQGYVAANGAVLNINTNQALFAVIGATYGGNGSTTFALPDLRGRAVIGWGDATAQTSAVPFGTKRGAETATLNANQLPAHTHPATFTATSGPQQVTIPAQAGSGSIAATATTDIVPGSSGVDPAANVHNYYLTGVTGSGAGPVTTTAPGTDKSTLIGTNVAVNTSTYKPPVDAKTVDITTVTGGTVAVGANPLPPQGPAAVSLISPQQALTACIAVQGVFPVRP